MPENGVVNSGSSSDCPKCLRCVRSADDRVKVIFFFLGGGVHSFSAENVSEGGGCEPGRTGRAAKSDRVKQVQVSGY